MARKNTKQQTEKYTVMVAHYTGATPSARFTFDATDTADATEKMHNWRIYHNMSREEVSVRKSTGNELTWASENSWVK